MVNAIKLGRVNFNRVMLLSSRQCGRYREACLIRVNQACWAAWQTQVRNTDGFQQPWGLDHQNLQGFTVINLVLIRRVQRLRGD